jgi:hypothetical protein
MKNKILLFSLFLFCPVSAFAYLDPGSGSMLLYFVIGVFASLIYSIKNAFFQIRNFVLQLFSKNKKQLKTRKNVIFYSESGSYWHEFKSAIDSLVSIGVECSYYTSDENDEGLKYKANGFDSLFIGKDRFSMLSLNYLSAKIVVLTTPQLDVLHLKRSKNVDCYIHLVHAITDVYNYKPFAFDFFDCIMCAGKHQIDSLRLIEKSRNLPEKKVLETGLVYFDYLQQSIEVKTNTKDKKTILVAPTWGDGGLFNKYGFSFVEDMAKENYNIILRPHPQSYVNDIELMNEVELRASKFSNISIDKRSTAIESMQNADLMISDISGIIFDFAFSLQKPIITFSDYSFDESRMLEINDVSSYTGASPKIWEMEVIKDITIQVKQANSKEILATIEELVTNPEKLNEVKKNILKVKEEYVFNYGKAGEVVAKQIEDILENGVKNTK